MLLRHVDAADKPQPAASLSKSKLHWVSSITSCFMSFSAILLSAHPEVLVDLIAYGKLVMCEVARHGCDGWKLYNTLFSQMKGHGQSSMVPCIQHPSHDNGTQGHPAWNLITCTKTAIAFPGPATYQTVAGSSHHTAWEDCSQKSASQLGCCGGCSKGFALEQSWLK